MENQTSPLLNWPYSFQGKNMEELRQSLVYTTLELENTRLTLTHVEQLLKIATTQRDEALQKQHSSIAIEEDPVRRVIFESYINGLYSSDSEDSMISSSTRKDSVYAGLPEKALRLISGKESLPEKGNLLEAVMKAGPLLQTLLLAGPLPQWRHPPPPLEAFEIPPMTIPAISSPVINANRKRVHFGGENWGYSSPEAKKHHTLILN